MADLKVERKRRYKVLLPVGVSVDGGSYSFGDELESEFTADEEWGHIESGLLGLCPEWYQVIGESQIEINMAEVPASFTTRVVMPGETFQAVIPLAREAQMIYHIRRVPPPADVKSAEPVKASPKKKES